MICPRCTAEFGEGITECPNCGVGLVAKLEDERDKSEGDADGELVEGKLVEAWSGQEEDVCVDTCKDFRKAGIPFKVSQHRYPIGRSSSDDYFKIGVPPEFLEQAKKVIAAGEIDAEELPAEEAPEEGIDAGEEDDYDKGEDRGEAKAEIWSGDAQDVDMIEMCLKENGIRAHVEAGEKGKKKISVASEHEKKAREVVKELQDGNPE